MERLHFLSRLQFVEFSGLRAETSSSKKKKEQLSKGKNVFRRIQKTRTEGAQNPPQYLRGGGNGRAQ